MIAATAFADKRVALFGLGGSGLVTARALLAGGAELVAFDDNPDSVAKAAAEGIPTADLRSIAWAEVAALVLSPGVPLTHPRPHWSVDLAKAADVAIIGDIEIFCRARKEANPSAPFIAITGTNGKSTTTALIAHILAASGLDVQMGGNIGRAVLSLEPPAEDRVHVVECSSYQIDLAPSLNPSVGILLNLTPDHLDRHGSMDAYAAIKERLVAGADHAVVGIDDEHCRAIADRIEAAGRPLTRISRQGTGGFDLSNHRVLRGAHNAQNAAAAIAACRSIGLDDDAIGQGLASFPGLKHRMQPVARRGKAIFVNDSKATNAEAAAPALASFDAIHWIAGGLPKSGGIASLSPLFGRIAKAYLIGEAAPSFAATLGDAVPFEISGTLERAVVHAAADAAQNASPEPAVLLSPACASFDQYRNFEMRGDAFVKAVAAIDGIEMLVPQPCGSE